jgi:response regulator RpfG family c-di-GMP phosphodiesterase
MFRPCFVVVDQEFPGSISTRKLVLETAKYNVLTAYSAREAVELLRRFPRVDGIVMNGSGHEDDCATLVAKYRDIAPGVRIILTSGRDVIDCGTVDLQLDNYDPRKLLEALAKMFPDASKQIMQHDDDLAEEYKDKAD